jgi:hypothetical protein
MFLFSATCYRGRKSGEILVSLGPVEPARTAFRVKMTHLPSMPSDVIAGQNNRPILSPRKFPKSPNATTKTHRTTDIPRRIIAKLKDRTALEVGIGILGLVMTGSRRDLRPSVGGLPRDIIIAVLFIVWAIQDVGWNSSLGGSHHKASGFK